MGRGYASHQMECLSAFRPTDQRAITADLIGERRAANKGTLGDE
jgi:hypothetical protein